MNAIIKIFNYRFYLKEFLAVFFGYLIIDKMFAWIIIPDSAVLLTYEKIANFLIFGIVLFSFDKLRFYEKVYVVLFSLMILRLVLESLAQFDSVFQQLTMYYVLFPVIYALFVKYINSYFDLDLLEFIAKFYLGAYLIFMVIYGRGFSFNLDPIPMNDYGPFSGDGRVLHSGQIYMLVVPCLWYLHRFINKHTLKFFIPLAILLVAILLHQHRSVWSCTMLSILIYIWISVRVNTKALAKIWNLALSSLLVIAIAFFFISNLFPEMIDFFAARFSEIFDPTKEGSTGNFRKDQREVYFELFLQRPAFGWTFEGFEMPNPLVDWWPPKTGQHFHEGYVEMLFYHGIAGFVFKFSIFLYIAYKAFSRKLSEQSIILISFCLSALLYQFNYVLPTIFWGHLGLCLYYIEKDGRYLGKAG